MNIRFYIGFCNENTMSDNPSKKAKKEKDEYEWMQETRLHVLHRPDTYIGSVEVVPMNLVVIKQSKTDDKQLEASKVLLEECSPALFKFVDEAIVNAIDNQRRDPTQKNISLKIDRKTGEIEISNDGKTIPIEKYPGTDMWLPTVLFSEFLSGSNFNDDQQRFTGGRNGIGIKATNTWSVKFEIEICNAEFGKKFYQLFEENMAKKSNPKITSYKQKKSHTCLRWIPDYKRLGMDWVLEKGLSEEIAAAIESRAYDACVCTRPTVNVNLNETKLNAKTIMHYAKAFPAEAPFATDSVTIGDDVVFSICAAAREPNNDPFTIGFVNGVRCCGGSHIDLCMRKINDIIMTKAKTKSKGDLNSRGFQLKNELTLIVSVLIVNPRFTSQTKEILDSKVGFQWDPSPSFRSAIERSSLTDRLIAVSKNQEEKSLQKMSKINTKSIPCIDKYDPATKLGKKGNHICTLLVTEGDSAKGLAVAGLTVIGRELFGVFPLRGKLMNVLKFTGRKLLENKEISNLMLILGLEYGKTYDEHSIQSLPYRHLVLLTDQDTDGSHIAGLCLNFMHALFPSVIKLWPDFVKRFATPIVRVTVGREIFPFFSIPEFEAWKEDRLAREESIGISKYYKGLGTSSNKLAKEYFSEWEKHTIRLDYSGENCDEAISLFFDEKRANCRKKYLQDDYDPDSCINYGENSTTYKDFLHKDMSHHCNADTKRSLPSVVDGLKPSQRKALWSLLVKNVTTDKKVAAAAAAAAEITAYHHGEASMTETITNLAKDFVGSNNIALLWPEGQFGSRHNPEAAQPRYIFTRLDPITRFIFPKEDDDSLNYEYDDGEKIEPTNLVPIIPMLLVNGASGIGTGWSCFVSNYNPRDVLDQSKKLLKAFESFMEVENSSDLDEVLREAIDDILPWYRGYTIPIEIEENSIILKGKFVRNGNNITISELPIGEWTEKYLSYLREKLYCTNSKDTEKTHFITDIANLSTDSQVLIELKCVAEKLDAMDNDFIEKLLHMKKTNSLTNMHVHNANGKLCHYPDTKTIIIDHGKARIECYVRRRERQIKEFEQSLVKASNKRRYIEEIIQETLIIKKMTKSETETELELRDYAKFPKYDYLLDMPNVNMTIDKVEMLKKEEENRKRELDYIRNLTPYKMWEIDLMNFEKALLEYEKRKQESQKSDVDVKPSKGMKRKK